MTLEAQPAPVLVPAQSSHPGPRPIQAVPPLLLLDHADPGSLQALVARLDFAPRHHDLAVRLAQRFLTSSAAQESLVAIDGQASAWERFFAWLAARIAPQGVRTPVRRRPLAPSEAELRVIMLLDQYRAGGVGMHANDCPLVHAANSLQA